MSEPNRQMIHRIYDIVLPPFRRRRMALLDRLVLDAGGVERVVDLGGAEGNWQYSSHRPHVTMVNISEQLDSGVDQFTHVLGDATQTEFADGSFDLAFSNSVIEHVGEQNWEAFANECLRLAPCVFVQTPSKWFPLEPHLLTPFVHYLPKGLQRKLLRNATLWGWLRRPNRAKVDEFVSSTTLLTRSDMSRLFPDCEIRTERFLGLPKSYIAVRVGP